MADSRGRRTRAASIGSSSRLDSSSDEDDQVFFRGRSQSFRSAGGDIGAGLGGASVATVGQPAEEPIPPVPAIPALPTPVPTTPAPATPVPDTATKKKTKRNKNIDQTPIAVETEKGVAAVATPIPESVVQSQEHSRTTRRASQAVLSSSEASSSSNSIELTDLTPKGARPAARASVHQIAPNTEDTALASGANPQAAATDASSTVSGRSSKEIRAMPPQRYFRSRRIKKGEVEKPWLKEKNPREKWVTIIPVIGILLGFGIAGVLIWEGVRSVVNHKYCMVLDEDFSRGLDPRVWTREVQLGGFGNGHFDMTTWGPENAFVEKGQLVIQPTLQDPSLINHNNRIDLRKGDHCTSDVWSNCYTGTNVTNGTIVNPVKSARLNTKRGASIRYGRMEVRAKLPAGDWLWPAIWMMPERPNYGAWPRSGEMDIMEARGNNYTYKQGGNNIVSSTLHWGPDSKNDAWWRNNVKRTALHTTYADGFHTYGIEWSEKYVFTYVDTRLLQVMYMDFNQPMWDYGLFPLTDANGTRLENPWAKAGANNFAAPFDKKFYLILNVAVGGTNGWFQDGASGKPWVDSSPTARRDFWLARKQWLPTWKDGGRMTIDSVKMWQQEGYEGCTAKNSAYVK